MNTLNMNGLHAAMRAQVDQQFLPCVSTAVLRGQQVVDTFCYGYADSESGTALREDHIFRAFSNTKLVTSCAVLLLWEKGLFQLDDPIENYIPELGRRRVLRPNAASIDDSEPTKSSITIRQLMTHTAGLSYGIFDPSTILARAYNKAQLRHPANTMKDFIAALSPLPLAFHPGTRWEYSIATDVLAYLVELVSGVTFGAYLAKNIFEPLGMADTDFFVPESKASRLTALYAGVDVADPTKPGLVRVNAAPYPGAYLTRPVFESGGGGLVTTLGDTVRLIQSMMPGDIKLLKPATISMMATNQLPESMVLQIPNLPPVLGRGFGLGSSVVIRPTPFDPMEVMGEVSWGGLAGTDWWFNPRLNIAGVLMTQRYFGPWGKYTMAFKQEAYKALASG